MLYPIAIEKGSATEEFGVNVPDVQGCFSAGDTFEQALKNAREAIAGHLEILAQDGKEIPFPSDIEKFLDDERYSDMVWAVVDIEVSRYLGKSEKINVTLPSRLIHLIDERVTKDSQFKSRSAFLAASAEKMLQG